MLRIFGFGRKPSPPPEVNAPPEAQAPPQVMPLTPEHGTAYYNKVRETIAASEKLAAKQAKPLIAKPARQAG